MKKSFELLFQQIVRINSLNPRRHFIMYVRKKQRFNCSNYILILAAI